MATREEESAILVEFEDYRGAPLSHDKAPNPLVKCAFIVVAIPIMVLIYLTVHGSAVSNFAISAQPQGPPSFSIHRGSGSDAYFATMQANTQRPPMRLANVGDGALADPLYGMEVSLQQQVMERLREASHAIEASKLHATQEAQIWLANIHAQVTAAMGQLASTSSDLTSRLSEVQNLLMVVQDNIASHVDQVLSSSPQLAAAQTAVASAMDSLMMRAQIIADNPHAMAARAAAAGAVADVQPQLTALREMLSSAVYSVRVYMGAHPWVAPALMGFVVAVATVMYLRGRRNDQSEQEWGPSLLRQASRLSPWKIFAHLRHVLVSALLLPVHFVMRLVRTIAPVRTTGIVNDSYISNVDFCTPHEAPFLPRSSSALASQAQPRPLIAATQGRDARHASPRRMHAAPATAPKTAEKVYDAAEQSEDDVDGALPLVDQLPMVEAALQDVIEELHSAAVEVVDEIEAAVEPEEHATADLSRTAQLLNTALDPNAAAEPEVVSPEDNSGAQDQVSGAPEIPPAPAEPKPAPFLTVSMQREAAVQDLMAAIQQLNHKLGSASPATRERFTKLIQRVVQFNPEPRTVAAMRGTKWELLYADTPSVYALTGINGLSTIDRMTQEISDKTMTTIIECGVADYLHPITDVFGTSHDYAEIQVTMNYGAAGNSHSVTQTLRSASFKPKKVFGQAFAIPSIPMPVLRQLPFGKFEVLYVDRALRITKTLAVHFQVDRSL
mmetsp:Transcript_41560/g.70060  ORF Transcript_41560/g.70060 Transcript_41560/m.70060 type:complete len:727 (+) Transcript_41560:31-2211(+)